MQTNGAVVRLRNEGGWWVATSRHPVLRRMFVYEPTIAAALRAVREQATEFAAGHGYRFTRLEAEDNGNKKDKARRRYVANFREILPGVR
jgi:hypothetical protein